MICRNYFPPTQPLPSSGPCLKLCILLPLRVELLVFLNFACFPWVSGPWVGYKALLFLTLVPITGPDPDHSPAGACPSPALERCTGLSWSPFSCLAPGWGCGTNPDPREPLAPQVSWNWALCGLCFPVLFWVVSCYFTVWSHCSHFLRSALLWFEFLCFSSCSRNLFPCAQIWGTSMTQKVLLFFTLKCAQRFWFPWLFL